MAKAIRQKIFECDGVEVYDEYYWFRDRSNPKVLKYLEDENAYAEAMMEDTSELQDALYEVLGFRCHSLSLFLYIYLSCSFFLIAFISPCICAAFCHCLLSVVFILALSAPPPRPRRARAQPV